MIDRDGTHSFSIGFSKICTPPGGVGVEERWGVEWFGPIELSGNRITVLVQSSEDNPPWELGAGTVGGDETTVTVTGVDLEHFKHTYTFRKVQDQ